MRHGFLLIPLVLGAAVMAQSQATPDELIGKLGHEDYSVREEATRALIALGEKAVPALEKALGSEDLEVRLRAGRALRAIRGGEDGREPLEEQEQPGEKPAPPAPGAMARTSGIELHMNDGKVRLRRTEVVDGEQKVTEYEAASIEELKEKHPELKPLLERFSFQTRPVRPFDFDMDRFWREWRRDFPEDDFWQRWQEDLRRDAERMRRFAERWQDERRNWQEPQQEQAPPAGRILGIRASKPEPVLDAQLGLRGAGLVVDAVEKDTPADVLGLERYDVLLELNGVEIGEPADVARAMPEDQAQFTAKVVRRGKPMELSSAPR